MALIIGLTGGIGSGKSTAARLFAELGADVIDTDVIAHQLTTPNAPALAEIAAQLGAKYILPDGSLDRAGLRQRIFCDSSAKVKLEAILHPRIRRQAAALIAASRAPYALVVVPLLIETGAYRDLIQRMLLVDCSEEDQVARTVLRSGLTQEQTLAIMDNQASRRQRLSQTNDVIENNGDFTALERQVHNLHEKYRRFASIPQEHNLPTG